MRYQQNIAQGLDAYRTHERERIKHFPPLFLALEQIVCKFLTSVAHANGFLLCKSAACICCVRLHSRRIHTEGFNFLVNAAPEKAEFMDLKHFGAKWI